MSRKPMPEKVDDVTSVGLICQPVHSPEHNAKLPWMVYYEDIQFASEPPISSGMAFFADKGIALQFFMKMFAKPQPADLICGVCGEPIEPCSICEGDCGPEACLYHEACAEKVMRGMWRDMDEDPF